MKRFYFIDEKSENYFIAKRTEEELLPEVIKGMNIGAMKEIGNDILLQRYE